MNNKKCFKQVLVLCSTLSLCMFTSLSMAESSLSSKSNSSQKQWVGQTAPQFKLQDQHGKWHELKQYKGRWIVLYFYPKDDSPGCTEEARQFKTLYPQFLAQQAVVFGVSLDDVASHQKFSEKLGLSFPILADHKHELSNKLGVVRNLGIAKMAKRETFLIDPKGNIVFHYTSVNTQTHAAQVLADIKKISAQK